MKRHGSIAAATVLAALLPASAFAETTHFKPQAGTPRATAAKRVVVSAPKRNLDTRTVRGRVVARSAATDQARSALKADLGRTAVVQSDLATGGLSYVAKIDGYLTEPSDADPAAIALGYVRDHLDAFGLTASDLDTLVPNFRSTSPDAITHLQWVHSVDGVRVFDRDLRAAVDDQGRLLNVQGAPVHDPSVATTDPETTPRNILVDAQRSAGIAVDVPAAAAPVGAQMVTRFKGGDSAQLTVFPTAGTDQLAWRVITEDPVRGVTYGSVIDDSTGKVLYRANLTSDANSASVFDFYPGAAGAGGVQKTVDLAPWLDAPATTRILAGNNAHVWLDVDDDGQVGTGQNNTNQEEVNPSTQTTPSQWAFTLNSFPTLNPAPSGYEANCPTSGCTWNPLSQLNTAQSWTANAYQNGTQLFYFVNKAHDYFLAPPVGFTAATRGFEGTDRLLARALAGALGNGAGSLDPAHLNNANMTTLPDGTSPFMRMYLFAETSPGSATRTVNGGDDGSIVYHEYVHAISGRTIVDASGMQAMNTKQSGAMNEAWSDWFAEDMIYGQGLATDNPTSPGDVVLGAYESAIPIGKSGRTQPLDCPPGGGGAVCPGSPTAGPGGYTYADMGQVNGRDTPEVHADGEIWGETLWDVRTRVGHDAALAIVSGGQKLTPPNPSMLDARNAILQSALNVGGLNLQYQAALAFAGRGMGVNARTINSDDAKPTEDFTAPAAPTTCSNGTVVAPGVACPAPPPPPVVVTPPVVKKVATALVKFTSKPTFKKSRLSVSISCPKTEKVCAGTLRVAVGKKSAGAKSFVITKGKRKTIVLKITKAKLRKIAGKKKHSATLSIRAVAIDTAGNARTTRATLKVKF